MVTRELVKDELENLDTQDLSKVYDYIKQVEQHPVDEVEPKTRPISIWGDPDDEGWAYLWLGK
jgi:Asp-tRNA(Asn)/Glu-tRNA(Gln) amidotransferase C subunit